MVRLIPKMIKFLLMLLERFYPNMVRLIQDTSGAPQGFEPGFYPNMVRLIRASASEGPR